MDRKIVGFTLIELLVVIVIVTVIIGMVLPKAIEQTKRYSIESSTKKIYSFLQEARERAFSEKFKFDVFIASGGKKICLKCDSSDNECEDAYGTKSIKCSNLGLIFVGNNVNISKRGTFSGGPIYYPKLNGSSYDCIIISDLRIKLGKCNGNP